MNRINNDITFIIIPFTIPLFFIFLHNTKEDTILEIPIEKYITGSIRLSFTLVYAKTADAINNKNISIPKNAPKDIK